MQEDDSESLELLDVEQYLASDEEVIVKYFHKYCCFFNIIRIQKEKEGAGQGERDIIKV